jgi:hypothetical protein
MAEELRQQDPVDFERELFLSKEDLRPRRVAQVAAVRQAPAQSVDASNVVLLELWRSRQDRP